MQNISERQMVKIYIENKREHDNDKIIIFKEVKRNQKRIDIVEVEIAKNGLEIVHGIEFKVFNWKSGFRQALGNRVLLPFNSVAIWDSYEKKIDKDELKREGIGLIIVKKDRNIVRLKPKKSKYLIELNYKKIKDNLEKYSN
jgi:hypothetical protein